jgi:hypothetical protein
MMGNPHWRLVWLNPQGIRQEIDGGGTIAITAVTEWATPVLAFPYWPERNILPGEMRPAGGILPFDAAGNSGRVRLSWQGGVDAWFYRELSAARNAAADSKRRPEYFDWPRFRELLDSEAIPEAVRDDPWLADWRDIAVRTVQSGFDRRRIKVQAEEELPVPMDAVGGSPFFGPSPFAKPLVPEPGAEFHFRVTPRRDTYLSAGGILRVSRKAWVYYPFMAAGTR